jgi:ubiquinone/menaquinone biosynthesis C-methylase UbiE
MGASKFMASQLRKPSGMFGKIVMSRFFNRSSAAINKLTLASLSLEPDDLVLEVGFGSGDLIGRIAPIVSIGSVAGVDFSPEMVDVCARRFSSLVRSKRVQLQCAAAEKLPYHADCFTKACTVNTIYFWPDASIPLAELRRVLRVGGRLVVGFSPPAALEKLPVTRHGFALYGSDDVRRLLKEAGFGHIEILPGSGPRGEFVCAVGIKQAGGGARP